MISAYMQQLPIRTRLLLPIVLIVLGSMAVAWSYERSMHVMVMTGNQQHALKNLQLDVKVFELDIAHALQYEKDFLIHHEHKYQVLHNQTLDKVLQDMQRVAQQIHSLNVPLNMKEVRQHVMDYQRKFDALTQQWAVIGLNENQGIRGAMRTSIHAIEKKLDAVHAMNLSNSMLQMRRHEKDYLMRKKPLYVEEMASEQLNFDALLQESHLSASLKQEINHKMNGYEQSFLNLVVAMEDNQKLLQDLRSDIVKTPPLLDAFDATVRTLVQAQEDKLNQLRVQQEQQIGFSLLLILLIVSGVLWWIAQSIRKPLQNLLDVLSELVDDGNLARRLHIDGKHELATLAGYINQFMDGLSDMVAKVQASGENITVVSNQLAGSSREQESTVTEQAITTQQMATSSREIASTAATLQENMARVTALARETDKNADQSQEDLQALEDALSHMLQASEQIGERFGELNDTSSNINQVVTTISKVADQTNLLSLNAAIEAEKAGEYGRGFAVVAAEIRRLANQTAVATVEIEQIVKNMQSAVSAGVMGMDKFSDDIRSGVDTGGCVREQLQQVIDQVRALTPCVEEANEGLVNQTIGAQEINSAIEQLQTTTQQTQNMVLRTNQVIEELHQASGALEEGMLQFRLRQD